MLNERLSIKFYMLNEQHKNLALTHKHSYIDKMREEHKRTLHIIHTKNTPTFKLSNEASCLTPTKLLKGKKNTGVERERLLCGVCFEGEHYPSFYTSLWSVWPR